MSKSIDYYTKKTIESWDEAAVRHASINTSLAVDVADRNFNNLNPDFNALVDACGGSNKSGFFPANIMAPRSFPETENTLESGCFAFNQSPKVVVGIILYDFPCLSLPTIFAVVSSTQYTISFESRS